MEASKRCLTQEEIVSYIDNLLGKKEAEAVEDHLAICERCLAEVVSVYKMKEVIKEIEILPTEVLKQRAKDLITPTPERRPLVTRKIFLYAASAAVILICVFLAKRFYIKPEPSRPTPRYVKKTKKPLPKKEVVEILNSEFYVMLHKEKEDLIKRIKGRLGGGRGGKGGFGGRPIVGKGGPPGRKVPRAKAVIEHLKKKVDFEILVPEKLFSSLWSGTKLKDKEAVQLVFLKEDKIVSLFEEPAKEKKIMKFKKYKKDNKEFHLLRWCFKGMRLTLVATLPKDEMEEIVKSLK